MSMRQQNKRAQLRHGATTPAQEYHRDVEMREAVKAAVEQVNSAWCDSSSTRASWVPALIRPPDLLASLQEWLDYRAGLDVPEGGLRVSHHDLEWLDGMKAFRAEADAGIARRRAAARKSG